MCTARMCGWRRPGMAEETMESRKKWKKRAIHRLARAGVEKPRAEWETDCFSGIPDLGLPRGRWMRERGLAKFALQFRCGRAKKPEVRAARQRHRSCKQQMVRRKLTRVITASSSRRLHGGAPRDLPRTLIRNGWARSTQRSERSIKAREKRERKRWIVVSDLVKK